MTSFLATPLLAQAKPSSTLLGRESPRFQKGDIFPWTICDCPLRQAIVDNMTETMSKTGSREHTPKILAATRRRSFIRENRKATHPARTIDWAWIAAD
jgi:hypothetical protein